MNAETIREKVRTGYAEIARTHGSCCGTKSAGCGSSDERPDQLAQHIGYSPDELEILPDGANMGLSCGNPNALAVLRPGEVVLDLGSGGGFDVFIAGSKVGANGRAMGVDMTPDMLAKARKNVASYRERTGLDNVEFRLGEIEHLPVADNSVDAIISNCVINLSPDKPQVWREMARVLKPGGRVAVSDIALLKPLPPAVSEMVESLVGCVAGAALVSDTERMVRESGLIDVELTPKTGYVDAMVDSEDVLYQRIMTHLPSGAKPSDYITSVEAGAYRPMSEPAATEVAAPAEPKRLNFFERYLSLWVLICMVVGVAFGKLLPDATAALSKLEFGQGSQVNVPIAVLIWLMIYPMMLKVDFGAIGSIAKKPKGLMVTLFVNWLVKPFSMALFAWIFIQNLFSTWIDPETAKSYTAGLIILAAAPCTAMVFVWSYLTEGDPVYTLVQVAVNDLIMLVAFAPIVMFLCGVANVVVPSKVLVTSVVVFIVIPLVAGWLTRTILLKSHGKIWFEENFLAKFHPVTVLALLLTLVLIFAFQAENLTTKWFAVLLLAVPIIIQVYFNSSLAYVLMRWLKVPHNVASPGALIGASNFFELAVAVAITLFGPGSGAALATVVGVLVEVPVMLSVCRICNQSRPWYQRAVRAEGAV